MPNLDKCEKKCIRVHLNQFRLVWLPFKLIPQQYIKTLASEVAATIKSAVELRSLISCCRQCQLLCFSVWHWAIWYTTLYNAYSAHLFTEVAFTKYNTCWQYSALFCQRKALNQRNWGIVSLSDALIYLTSSCPLLSIFLFILSKNVMVSLKGLFAALHISCSVMWVCKKILHHSLNSTCTYSDTESGTSTYCRGFAITLSTAEKLPRHTNPLFDKHWFTVKYKWNGAGWISSRLFWANLSLTPLHWFTRRFKLADALCGCAVKSGEMAFPVSL